MVLFIFTEWRHTWNPQWSTRSTESLPRCGAGIFETGFDLRFLLIFMILLHLVHESWAVNFCWFMHPFHMFDLWLHEQFIIWLTARSVLQGVAITQENSLLDNTARIEGWLARFPMFDWVGGRTSEMSAVGLLPAALQVSAFPFFLYVDSTCFQVNRWGVVARVLISRKC